MLIYHQTMVTCSGGVATSEGTVHGGWEQGRTKVRQGTSSSTWHLLCRPSVPRLCIVEPHTRIHAVCGPGFNTASRVEFMVR